MHLSLDHLKEQLQKHLVAHEQINRQAIEIVGAIKTIQKLITDAEQVMVSEFVSEAEQAPASAE